MSKNKNNRYDSKLEKKANKLSRKIDDNELNKALASKEMADPVKTISENVHGKRFKIKGLDGRTKKLLKTGCVHSYFNKKGKLCHRVFEGTIYKCYGRSNHVANELYNQDGIIPAYLPQVGWVTHMGDGLFTHGTRYTLTKVGEEVVDDNSGQSSQS